MRVEILMAAIAVCVAVLFVLGVWRATKSRSAAFATVTVLAALMAVQHWAAASGALGDFERRPPPLMLLVIGMFVITAWFAFSKTGGQLANQTSFTLLVASQAFRLPLELTMHRAATEGAMPLQMSYSGWNFDILTGASAVLLSILLAMGKAPMRVVRLWNSIGFCLLINIIGIAVASLPLFAAFGPDQVNTWVTYPPIQWLPGVLVPAALLGHLLIWRKLAAR